jgi:hypothetical protein
MCNNIMFGGDSLDLSSLMDQIIYISWFLFIVRIENSSSFAFSY